MRDNDRRKYGNSRLAVHDGYGRRKAPSAHRAELIDLAARVRAQFALCRSVRGTVPSRAVQQIIDGEQKPLASTGKRAIEMLDEGVPIPVIKEALFKVAERWVDELAAKRGDQPDPTRPTAAALRRAA